MEFQQGPDLVATPKSERKAKSRKGPRRTFTGCWSCRLRRVKCDELIPTCTRCLKIRQPCAGYEQNLVWVTSDGKTYRPGGRRFLDPGNTWRGLDSLDAESVDRLIDKCDAFEEDIRSVEFFGSPFTVFRGSPVPHRNSDVANIFAGFEDLSNCEVDFGFESFPRNQFTPLLSPVVSDPLKPGEANLFHHYISYVAPMLLPLDDTGNNPWATYPAIALHYSSVGQKYLLHALMAHAAIFCANIGADTEHMLAEGGRYYVLAMEELRESIEENTVDYVGLLTTMMTFLFIELYRGTSKTWRHHYIAAWNFLQQQRHLRKWAESDDAWYATQSFYLLRIMSEASLLPGEPSSARHTIPVSEDDIPLAEFSSDPRFGYTIGSSNILMTCISDINKYSQRGWMFGMDETDDGVLTELLNRLEDCRKAAASGVFFGTDVDHADEGPRNHQGKQAHHRAYTAGALIYFYHQFYGLPPKSMAPYVCEILESILLFSELTRGNYTMWPMFIAAVEAYEEEDIFKFRELLNEACGVGQANRLQIKELVERIWHIRETQATHTGQDISMVRVDWRSVMHALDLDVLLT